MREYGIRDLANALVAGRRWHNAAPELRAYHARKLTALQRAFDVDAEPEASAPRRVDAVAFQDLLDATVTMLVESHSPFDGFLEAPREVAAMYQRHGGAIGNASHALTAALTDLLIDLLTRIHKIPKGRTASAETLRQHGFNPEEPEPDPLDYW